MLFNFIEKYFWYLVLLLFIIGIWEDLVREKGIKDLKRIWTDRKDCIGFLQRILDYLFNKIMIRQFLNPYFFFPFAIIFATYLGKRGIFSDSNSVILFLTFLAILWYSRETWALRKEQQKTNEILIGRPLIIIVKEEGDYIGIKNHGNNIAKHISIKFVHNDIPLKEIKYNTLNHTQELVKYPIDKEISNIIDSIDKKFIVEVSYYNFQSRRKHITIFELDDSILFDSRVGRFKIKEDK